MIAIAN